MSLERGLLCLALGLVVLLLPCAVVSLTTEELLGRTLLLQSALLMICQLPTSTSELPVLCFPPAALEFLLYPLNCVWC